MKAIVLTGYGDVDQLQLRELPEPEPGAGQIKVRVASGSINPIDWKVRRGDHKANMPLELPAILGRDVAGVVVQVGSNVTAFHVGDHVLGLVKGSYAEFVVAPAESWAKIPARLDVTNAGALPLVLLTGDQLADATLDSGLADGLTLLVTGALGSVGRVALWSLKHRGARVIAGVRKKQLEEAKSLGVERVVALDDPSALSELQMLDGVADTVGGETIQRLLSKIKPGGIVGSVLGETPGAEQRGLKPNAFMAHPDAKRLAELAEAVASGSLLIPIVKRFPLAEAAAAQAFAEHGAGGKVLLTM